MYFDDLPAWEELSWEQGAHLQIGKATVQVIKPIQRCAATNVNPLTAKRDLKIPQTLQKTYQHNHMGVYVEVVGAGEFGIGDALELV